MKTAPVPPLLFALAASCAPAARVAPVSSSSSVTRSVVVPQSSPRPTPEAPEAPPEMRELVDAHNARRAAHCAPPLAWSPEVAAVAQRYAERLAASGCGLVHSRGPYGENLFAASPVGSVEGRVVADAWYGEASRYDFARPGLMKNQVFESRNRIDGSKTLVNEITLAPGVGIVRMATTLEDQGKRLPQSQLTLLKFTAPGAAPVEAAKPAH